MEEKIKEMKREAKKKGASGIAGGNYGRSGGMGATTGALGTGISAGNSYKTPAASSEFSTSNTLFDSYSGASAATKAKPGGGGKAMKLGTFV